MCIRDRSCPSVAFAPAAATSSAPSTFGVPTSVVDWAGSGALRVAPAESTPRTVRISLAKSGFEECATITPIRSYAITTDPPASATAFCTRAETPCPGRTLTT